MKNTLIAAVFCGLMTIGLASSGEAAIDAKLIATCDYGLQDRWHQTIWTEQPEVIPIDKVYEEQSFWVYLLLSNFETEGSKKASVVFDLKAISSDGQTQFERTDIVAVDYQVADPSAVLLGQSVLEVSFEKGTPVGTYQLVADIRDKIGGTTTQVRTEVELREFDCRIEFASDSIFNQWMMNYYKNPSPGNALDAFKYFSRRDLFEESYFPCMGFFIEVFSKNQFLIPFLTNEYHYLPFEKRVPVLVLLRYLDYKSLEFFSGLDEREGRAYQTVQKRELPTTEGEIKTGTALDLLWGQFWASGRYEPLKKIVGALELRVSDVDSVTLKNPTTPEEKRTAQRNQVYKAAKWSLGATSKSFDLIRNYLAYMVERENFSASTNEELTPMFTRKKSNISPLTPEQLEMLKKQMTPEQFEMIKNNAVQVKNPNFEEEQTPKSKKTPQ